MADNYAAPLNLMNWMNYMESYLVWNAEIPSKPTIKTDKSQRKRVYIKLRGSIRFDQCRQTRLVDALFDTEHKRRVSLRPDRLRPNRTLTSPMLTISLASANTRELLLLAHVSYKWDSGLPCTASPETMHVEEKMLATEWHIHKDRIWSGLHRSRRRPCTICRHDRWWLDCLDKTRQSEEAERTRKKTGEKKKGEKEKWKVVERINQEQKNYQRKQKPAEGNKSTKMSSVKDKYKLGPRN